MRLLAFLLLLAACGAGAPAPAAPTNSAELAIVGARIYPSPEVPPLSDGVILVGGGKILAVGTRDEVPVPPGARTIDATGATVLAGFWNCHVHFMEPKWEGAQQQPAERLTQQLREMLTGYGFTSVVDAASSYANTDALRQRIEAGEVPGPRILAAGAVLFPPDGVPYYVREQAPPEVVAALPQPATAEEAVQQVRLFADVPSDIVKLFVVSWVARGEPKPMPQDVVRAAVAEAHRQGKLVYAHPSTAEGIELVLDAGVDVLAHSTEEPELWTDEVVARLRAARVSLIPTLTLFGDASGPAGIGREVKSYADAGGQILFGTDIGFLPDYDPTREYELLAQAGLTFPQILAMLTTAPAERFGLAARIGTVATGKDADLVILEGDPAAHIRALAQVRATFRAGRQIAGR